MSQIRVHVSRPEDPAVPNTGTLTQPTPTATSSNGTDFYFGLGIIIAVIMIAILPAFFYKKWKKQGFSKRQLIPRILLLAVLSFGLSFAGLTFVKTNTDNTLGASTENELTVTAGDVDIYIELEDEPVFASATSVIKVDKATDGGYLLKAYASSTDLISNTDSGKKILGLIASEPTTMAENTWGISLTEAASQEANTWQALPTEQTNALTIKDTTAQTATNDQTTVYFGVYVSPDTEPGTYVGTINYSASSYLVLQDVGEWGDSVHDGQEVFAVDSRDGKGYTVARLADGRLWITQNLRVDPRTANITTNNTNNPTATFLSTRTTAIISNDWCGEDSSECLNQLKWYSVDEQTDSANGLYYNWYTATAGNGTYDMAINSNAAGDICPSGWHIPTGGSTGEYAALDIALGGTGNFQSGEGGSAQATKWRASPNNFSKAGYYDVNSNSVILSDTHGLLFTSTKMPSGGIHYTSYSTTMNPGIYGSHGYEGYSIRCIANPTINDLTYMQDFSTLSISSRESVLASMTEESQYQLKDKRDEKSYWISKLKDGHVWMTQNLALIIPTDENQDGYADVTYTHQDTDLGWGSDVLSNTWTPTAGTASGISGWRHSNSEPSSIDLGYTNYPNPDQSSDVSVLSHFTEGIYYNWTAAIAVNNSNIYPSSTIDNTDNNPQNSICPAGWRLPTVSSEDETLPGSTNEYARINYIYNNGRSDNGDALFNYPTYFTRSGNFWHSIRYTYGSAAVLWSSTAGSNNRASHVFIASTSNVTSATAAERLNGYSLRCVVR